VLLLEEIINSDLHSRIGSFSLPHGKVITPTLLPVIDPKENIITAEEMLSKFGFNFVITSAYLYYKRYGMPNKTKTIHEILMFQGNIMMDSGAYQILAYGDVDIDPLQSLDIQSNLSPDVGVILDVPIPPTDTYESAQLKIYETIKRIKLSVEKIKNHPEIIWTAPIQGGKNTSLIREFIQKLNKEDLLKHFNFYALGSVAPIMSQYDYQSLFSMIYEARKLLTHNIPLHLFGAGHPMIFPFIVALGCDTFDSAAYILFAKENRYMGATRTYQLANLTEFPCSCEICSKWSPKELIQTENRTRIRNLALHNLYVSVAEIKQIRVAIREGRLWELLEQKALSHPLLYRAYKHILKNIDSKYWEFGTPITKSAGLKVFNTDSFHRPEFTRIRGRILRNYQAQQKKLLILISSGKTNPIEMLIHRRDVYEQIEKAINHYDIVMFLPFIGLIPVELVETYPFSQSVFSSFLSEEIIEKAISEALKFLKAKKYEELIVFNMDKEEVPENILTRIEIAIKNGVKRVKKLERIEDLKTIE